MLLCTLHIFHSTHSQPEENAAKQGTPPRLFFLFRCVLSTSRTNHPPFGDDRPTANTSVFHVLTPSFSNFPNSIAHEYFVRNITWLFSIQTTACIAHYLLSNLTKSGAFPDLFFLVFCDTARLAYGLFPICVLSYQYLCQQYLQEARTNENQRSWRAF